MKVLSLLALTALLISGELNAANIAITQSPQTRCKNLILSVEFANSEAERFAILGRLFSEDYPIFHSKEFRKSIDWALRSKYVARFRRNGDQWLDFVDIQKGIRDLKVNRAGYADVLSELSSSVTDSLLSNFYPSRSPTEYAKMYGISTEDYLALLPMVQTIKENRLMVTSLQKLIEEVIYASLDMAARKNEMHLHKSRSIEGSFYVLFPFTPGVYCYLGRCLQFNLTKKKIVRDSVKKIIEEGPAASVVEESRIAATEDLALMKATFSELVEHLKKLPQEGDLELYEKTLSYDREFQRSFHALTVKGVNDHAKFTDPKVWDLLRTALAKKSGDDNAQRNDFALNLRVMQKHLETFRDSLSLQLWATLQAQESLEKIETAVRKKVTTLPGNDSLTENLHRDELLKTLERTGNSQNETIAMVESIRNWTLRVEEAREKIRAAERKTLAIGTSLKEATLLLEGFKEMRSELGIATK